MLCWGLWHAKRGGFASPFARLPFLRYSIEMNTQDTTIVTMEKIESLCKRRGFVFAGSEIYGGLAGTFDYGPLGVALKKNIENLWWRNFVDSRDDMYGLDAAQISSQKVWEASGHLSGFNDPSVVDIKTKKSYRADHIIEEAGFSAVGLTVQEMTALIREKKIKSVDGNDFTETESFNLMFPVSMGASHQSADIAYLRGELAQGMFTNFKNVMDSVHPKLPFGLAQCGKAFRNEIAAKQYVFRTREFSLMEFEYFFDPKKEEWQAVFEYWREEMYSWIDMVGIDREKCHEIEKEGADLAHYSKRTIDIEFNFPFGQKELYGLAYRTDYDLKKHQEHSGISHEYLDEETREKFIPHAMEPTFGIDRTLLAVLTSAYKEDSRDPADIRVYLGFTPKIAPIKVAVLPLLKNKEKLTARAREIYTELKKEFVHVVYDETGSIGKRYRRQDEIGTPFCVTIDFDTIGDDTKSGDGTVTVRYRDSAEQKRVSLGELQREIREVLA